MNENEMNTDSRIREIKPRERRRLEIEEKYCMRFVPSRLLKSNAKPGSGKRGWVGSAGV
jgi:hypothetical protein